MLINFCNPNQLLAAMNIEGSVITLFWHAYVPKVETEGLIAYIDQLFKIKLSPHESDASHKELYHLQSSHLTGLQHCHFDLERTIDQRALAEFVEALKKYQDKDQPSIRADYEKRGARTLNLRGFTYQDFLDYTLENFLGFETNKIPHLPVLTTKNLKRVEEQFQNKSTSSSRTIINYLNEGSLQYDLPKSDLVTTQFLMNSTCPEVQTLAIAGNERDRVENTLVNVLNGGTIGLAALAGLAVLLGFRREEQRRAKSQPRRLEQPQQQPTTASRLG